MTSRPVPSWLVRVALALLILALLAEAATGWYRILTGRAMAPLTETPYVRTRWAESSP